MNHHSKTIALISGTGLVLDLPLEEARVHRDVDVTFGHESGRILYYVEGFCGDLRVIVLPRHGPTLERVEKGDGPFPTPDTSGKSISPGGTVPFSNRPDRSPAMLVNEKGHEAHVWLLSQLGVSAVYAFSAVGALDREVPLAHEMCFVVPHDYARGLGASIHSFGRLAKTVHPGMREPFSPALRSRAAQAIEAAGARALSQGLYIYSGPDQFETDAEVRALLRLFDGEPYRLVGMTAGPELVLCRQMEIPFAVICANANYAQGIAGPPVTHDLILDSIHSAAKKLREIAWHIVQLETGETTHSPP